MEIEWHGLSCFSIFGKDASILIDPYRQEHAGLKLSKLKADIILANSDFDFHHAVENVEIDAKEHIFDWPGEYEAKNVTITAIPAFDRPKSAIEKGEKFHRVLLFAFEVDGVRICHLSNLGHKLTPEMLEAIGEVDILLIPVGGKGVCLDAEKAHEVIEQLEPRVVIPMYYNLAQSKIQLALLDEFLKEIGLKSPRKESSFKIKSRTELPGEHTEYVVLEPVLK